jgi:hypothetical protein
MAFLGQVSSPHTIPDVGFEMHIMRSRYVAATIPQQTRDPKCCSVNYSKAYRESVISGWPGLDISRPVRARRGRR